MLLLSLNSQSSTKIRFLIVACVLLLCGAFTAVNAQQECPPNNRPAWPKDSTITYHIGPGLGEEAASQIRSAMAKWDLDNQTNGSGVRFVERLNPMQIPAALNFEVGVNPVTNPDGSTTYAPGFFRGELNANGQLIQRQ